MIKQKCTNIKQYIIDFLCCKLPRDKFYKYEKLIIALSLFALIFYYTLIFEYNYLKTAPNFSWNLYPFLLILSLPLFHSIVYHIKNKNFKLNKLDFLFVFFIIYCIIATIFSTNTEYSIYGKGIRSEGLITIIFYFLIYLLAKNTVTKKNIIDIINVIFIFGILQVIMGILQSYIKYNAFFDEMAYGYVSNPNMYGLLMGMLATISLSLYLNTNEETNKYKKYYLICSILFYIGVILSESAGPFFMFILTFIIQFIYYLVKKVKIKKLLYILAIIIVLFPVIQFSNKYVNEQYYKNDEYKKIVNPDYTKLYTEVKNIFSMILPKNTIAENNNISDVSNKYMGGRPTLWKLSFNEGIANWKNGVGLDCLEIITFDKGQLKILDKAHNQYIDIFVSTGLFGLITYLLFIIGLFILGIRQKDPILRSLWFGFIYYSIEIFGNISTPFAAVYYYIIIGLIVGLSNKKHNTSTV